MNAQPSQFDSHRFVKRLTKAGVSEQVAEILAEEHASLILPVDVATKSNVVEAKAATSAEIAGAKAATSAEIAEVKDATSAEIAGARDATSAEIARVRAETKAEIALAVAELKELIVETQRSTLKWMFGMMLAFTGIMLAAMANFR